MKNLLFGLIATVLFSVTGNAQNIEESTVIFTKGRVIVKGGGSEKSARSFYLQNFDKNNKLLTSYAVEGHIFTDDGSVNDVKAGDGIYTSIDLFPNLKSGTAITSYLMKSDLFKYNNELTNQTSQNKVSIKIGCKIRHVRTGYSILGIDCAHSIGGCIEFYDCEVTFEISW